MGKFNADAFTGRLSSKSGASSTSNQNPQASKAQTEKGDSRKRAATVPPTTNAPAATEASKRPRADATSKDKGVAAPNPSLSSAPRGTPPTPGRESSNAIVIHDARFDASSTVSDEKTATRWMNSIILPRDRQIPNGMSSKIMREHLAFHLAQSNVLLRLLSTKENDTEVIRRSLQKSKERIAALEKQQSDDKNLWSQKLKEAEKKNKETAALQLAAEASLKHERDLMKKEKEGFKVQLSGAEARAKEAYIASQEYADELFEHGVGAYNVALDHVIARLSEEKIDAPFIMEMRKTDAGSLLVEDGERVEASEPPPAANA